MKVTDTQYDRIRKLLFEAGSSVFTETQWMDHVKTVLKVSEDACAAVFRDMKQAELLVEMDQYLFVVNQKDYRVGSLRVIRPNFGFVGEKADSVYISKANFNHALDKDRVLVRIGIDNDGPHGVVVGVIRRERRYILGTFVKQNRGMKFEPYENKYPYTFNIKGDKDVNQRVIIAVDRVQDGVIHGHVHSILGLADEPGIDVLSVLHVHDLETSFYQDALDQAESIKDEIDDKALIGRMDHRNQAVITVDGEDAKDLDDAIYLERRADGYRLYVHIADVSHYVTPKSPLDVNALSRTSSIYLVDRVVPMLPKNLSNGVCSLHPHVDRLTLTCMMDIDHKGNLDNYAVYPSIIQSKRRMSYNEINQNDSWGAMTEMIHDMLDLAKILHYRRHQEGSIDFESDESKFVVDHEGNVLEISRRVQGEAEAMIEAFMVSANETVAKHCKYLEIPIMYRVHEKPDVDKMRSLSHTLRILGYHMKGSLDKIHPGTIQKAMEAFKDRTEGPIISRLMIRSMSKARYSTEPLGHFGLALEDYAHFTSPIRRYPDLWLHQCLRQYCFEHDFSKIHEDGGLAQESAEYISAKERDILEAERDVEKIKKAQYMVSKKGKTFDGVISGFSNYGIFVELENTVEGVIPFSSMPDRMDTDMAKQRAVGARTGVVYSLGQKIRIKVVAINLKEHEVEFGLLKERVHKRAKHRKKS